MIDFQITPIAKVLFLNWYLTNISHLVCNKLAFSQVFAIYINENLIFLAIEFKNPSYHHPLYQISD